MGSSWSSSSFQLTIPTASFTQTVSVPAAMTCSEVNQMGDPYAPEEIERWLDSIDPTTIEWRDAAQLRHIMSAREAVETAQAELAAAVAAARAAGDSWAMIGMALGVSRQAAWERFGRG
jgi:hypothetical protein